MADRYWVGGAGSWNSTTKWSTTSGGASGASVPTAADNVIFDTNSGAAHFTVTVTDNATCANLTITPEPIVGVTEFAVSNGFVIAGTFSTSSTAGNRRLWFRSSTYGLMRDMQIAAIGSVSDVDFRDIRVTGAGGTLSGTRIGDLRGNSGITFNASKTVYWNFPGGSSWDQNAWAATSGGAVSTDNYPLAQDTAVIENAGLNTGSTLSLSLSVPYIGSIDLSSRTLSLTITIFANTAYGNWTNGSGVSFTGASIITFSGRKTQTITSAGKTLSFPVTVDSYGGTVELADALDIGSNILTITNGTFDTKNYSVVTNRISSSNANVRSINLGSSTVTISGDPVVFTNATNLSFNAGTSTIICTATAPVVSAGPGVNFYNLSFTATTGGNSRTLSGSNTFNNLTIAAPASAGLITLSASANQTINGTLTVTGASAVRRIFLISNTLGTQRDLTVGSLAATDCDFRDINILGTAAGSAPTRAGDCGGNAGITFPAPKTVYWNLAGAQNWSATGWAASSGGTPDINNFPLAQDTAVFDNTGAAGTVNIQVFNIGTINASSRTTAITLGAFGQPNIYGNFALGTGVTIESTPAVLVFSGRGVSTITSNGITITRPITIECATGAVQLADALTLGSTRTLTLTSGTFDAVSYNVTVGLFTDSGSALKTLRMGSGTWTLSGIGSIWTINGTTNFNFYKGTANILLSDTSTSTRTFSGNGLSYNKLTIGGTTGTSTTNISNNNQFTELASTKTVAHTIGLQSNFQIFGAWTVTGTVGNVVTVTGTSTSHVIAGARVSGVDYLAMGTIGFAATSPGEFYAGANSTGTNATIIKTAAPAAVTRYWRGGTGTWDPTTTTNWSASSGGAGGASVPTSADAVVFDLLSNATAYTVTCTATQLRCGSLTMAGPLTGNVTWAGSAPLVFHDNVSLAATGITRTYSGYVVLSGSTTGRTFTTNGISLANDIILQGIGSGWSLGSALTTSTGSNIQLQAGTLNTANYNVSAARFRVIAGSSTALVLGSSTITENTIGFTAQNAINFTLDAGTSTINNTFGSPTLETTFPVTFYNYNFTSVSAGTVTLNGSNTFNNLSFTGLTSVGLKEVSVTANQTINGTLTLSAGTNATMRHFLRSDTLGTTRTLTCAAVSATDADFRDIAITGAAAPVSGTRLGDCKGNSGITFPAAKTVYWRVGSGGNWGSTGDVWSLTPSGASDVNNTPLAQDTAVFTSTLPTSGATVTINAAYNIGAIDMSARTSNTMTLATGSTAPFIYGNWINGTGTTLTGTGTMTFAGRGTQTITSAGKTFTQAFTINSPSGSVTLQDAFVSSPAAFFTLTAGTLNGNGYNFTLSSGLSSFTASGTLARTLAIGSGVWTFAGVGSSAWSAATATNLTVTGTGTISLTNASAKTFTGGGISYSGITLDQGGAGALTIGGNNTFANITNTYKATGATSIALGTTTQRVGSFGASGEAGRVLTVTGTSATSPATLVFTGSGQATTPTTDYLTITGVRAYSLDTTWYAGNNSTNNGSLGWYFVAGGGGAITAFITEASTAADSQSSLTSFGVGISETITASEAQAAGLLYLGTLSESATAADVAAVFEVYFAAVAESATASDLAAALANLNAAIQELTTGSDQDAASFLLNGSISEFLAALDSLAAALTVSREISEAATAQDSSTSVYTANTFIDETAQSADAASVAPSTFGAIALAVAEAIDSISPAGSVYNAALPVESAGITDFLVGSYLWSPIDDTQTANWQNVSNGQNPGWTQISDAQLPVWVVIPTVRD